MDIYTFTLFYIFIFGLIFGSFFNVVMLRPLSNETIMNPMFSKCPKCNHKLAWYDNIPLLSYAILRAKCRYCKAPIHWQYPLVEFLTAALFVCAYLKFGLTWQFLFMIIALSFFIIMSGTDFKEQIIFTEHYIPFIITGIVYGIVTKNYLDTGLGILFGFILMEALARSGYLFLKKRSFGDGDTYIAIGIGAFLGAKGIILTIILATLIQVIWALPVIWIKYFKNKKYAELSTMFTFILIVTGYCFAYNYNILTSGFLFWLLFILVLAYAFMVCKDLIMSAQLSDGGTYMPFGPALFAGATIIIFFGDKIYDLLRNISWLANIV